MALMLNFVIKSCREDILLDANNQEKSQKIVYFIIDFIPGFRTVKIKLSN